VTVSAILFKSGTLYTPEFAGVGDILAVGDRIVAMGADLTWPSWADGPVIDARGLFIFPGFIDGHVHIAGGGGEGGPQYRTPELTLSQLTQAGITTVVGLLGTDGTTRSVQGLLAKARALTIEGINAWIFTGAYQVPTRTITDSARNDLILIDRVIGVGEIAVSDHRGSHPSDRELAQLAGEARVGGLLGGKAGVLHCHIGGGPRRLQPLRAVIESADVPIETIVPTHVNRHRELLDDAVAWGRQGGRIDITTGIQPEPDDPTAVGPVAAAQQVRAAGVSWSHVTFSSDAGGSAPLFDERGQLIKMGVGSPLTLWQAVRGLHQDLGWEWPEALGPVTRHAASMLHLPDVGFLGPGARADWVMTDGTRILSVVAGGRLMVHEGRAVRRGTFETRDELS